MALQDNYPLIIERKICKECKQTYPKDETHKCKQKGYAPETKKTIMTICSECNQQISVAEDIINKGKCKKCSNTIMGDE